MIGDQTDINRLRLIAGTLLLAASILSVLGTFISYRVLLTQIGPEVPPEESVPSILTTN